MGYMRHHAIIITGSHGGSLESAHKKAREAFHMVSEIVESPINGYRSFFIPPDGSKEGWKESDNGDSARAEFLAWMEIQRYDGNFFLDWVEVQYGDDGGIDKVVQGSANFPEMDE